MGPLSAFIAAFLKAFQFRGRAPRAEFWWFQLSYTILMTVFIIIDLYTLFKSGMSAAAIALDDEAILATVLEMGSSLYSWSLTFWFGIICFIPRWTLVVRRYHDVGFTGWFLLINIIPVLGLVIHLIILLMPTQPIRNKYNSDTDGFGRSRVVPVEHHSDEEIAARKQEVSEYYRRSVLGQE